METSEKRVKYKTLFLFSKGALEAQPSLKVGQLLQLRHQIPPLTPRLMVSSQRTWSHCR